MNKKSAQSRPVIGITGDFRPDRYKSHALSWFNTGYYDRVIAAGGLPLLMPPVEDTDLMEEYLGRIDGLLLVGSVLDLDLSRRGDHVHPAVKPMPERRENFDTEMAQRAIERRMPILAIGSGMQLVNLLCGGSVYQHIPTDLPKALHHRDAVEENLRHVLEVVPGTRLDAIYGPGEVRVNTHHHMAVRDLAAPFRVSATCPDGVVEAYESVDDAWFCLGVQWHPESHTASALDLQIFEAFVDAGVPSAVEELHSDDRMDIIPMKSGLRDAA